MWNFLDFPLRLKWMSVVLDRYRPFAWPTCSCGCGSWNLQRPGCALWPKETEIRMNMFKKHKAQVWFYRILNTWEESGREPANPRSSVDIKGISESSTPSCHPCLAVKPWTVWVLLRDVLHHWSFIVLHLLRKQIPVPPAPYLCHGYLQRQWVWLRKGHVGDQVLGTLCFF